MELAMQEVVRRTGVSSRTLRHWGAVGLLPATRTGPGGLRFYDEDALVRLQRILLLRDLGLGLADIRTALAGPDDDVAALRAHAGALHGERDRLERRIRAVEATVRRRERGEPLMAEEMFDGFDHRAHRDEVTERWGARVYAESAAWWEAKSPAERAAFQTEQRELSAEWVGASEGDPAGAEAQALAARHAEWLAGIPGTPGYPDGPTPEYLTGLGDLYDADPRFGAVYGDAAPFVRDALRIYAASRRGFGAPSSPTPGG